jgi:hypothetical protein
MMNPGFFCWTNIVAVLCCRYTFRIRMMRNQCITFIKG